MTTKQHNLLLDKGIKPSFVCSNHVNNYICGMESKCRIVIVKDLLRNLNHSHILYYPFNDDVRGKMQNEHIKKTAKLTS